MTVSALITASGKQQKDMNLFTDRLLPKKRRTARRKFISVYLSISKWISQTQTPISPHYHNHQSCFTKLQFNQMHLHKLNMISYRKCKNERNTYMLGRTIKRKNSSNLLFLRWLREYFQFDLSAFCHLSTFYVFSFSPRSPFFYC